MMFFLINLNLGGMLIPMVNFPAAVKTKSIYMIKKAPSAFAKDEFNTFRDALIVGDLPPQPLEALVTFVEDIIRPIVTSETNQDKWPETVVTDVKNQTQEICSTLYTVQGQLKGKTLLPMPVNLEQMEENERRLDEGGPSEVDLQLKTSLEVLVIKWSQQINEVLQQDSSKPLKSGQHPTPYVEIAFWEERVQDLQLIYSQLNDDKVRRLAYLLEKTNSTYWPCFKTVFRNVVAALAEAQDILTHLKPLRRYLDNLQSANFDECFPYIEPLMQCVCLIWGHSRYYCSPARIIVLLQEICNMLISMARSYVDGTSIFQAEPVEGQVKTETVVRALQLFRDLYDDNKGELPIYFSQETEAKNWDFLPHLVFGRYDKFLDRMKQLKDFFDTSVEFYKLERIDFGGNKGKYLSAAVEHLYNDFTEFYQKYSGIQYDCSDPEDDSFDPDYKIFEEKVADMDQQLSAIFVRGFETCDTPESVSKLITTLGGLLDRPIIKQDFEAKLPLYTAMLDDELAKIKEMFDKVIAPYPVAERNQIYSQYPPYSASVYWARGMKERFEENMEQFKALELVVDDKEASELLQDKFTELSEVLDKMQEDTFKEWKGNVDSEAGEWLKENIFGTNPIDNSLVVNFRSELYSAMKEVQYLTLAGYEDIPATVNQIYGEKEVYRKNLVFLDQIAHSYNKILKSATPAEKEVLKAKLADIDKVLKDGKEQLKWSDPGPAIWEYTDKLRAPVADTLDRFQKSQDNVSAVKKLVQGWLGHPLYERKDGKKEQLLSLDEHAKNRKKKQYKEIEEMGLKVHELVVGNKELLYDKTTSDVSWRSYLSYVDGIVRDALVKTAEVSFGYLIDHTDTQLTPGPLFEVVMELEDSGTSFTPALDFTQSTSFMNLIDDIIQDILHQGSLILRVNTAVAKDYFHDLEHAQSVAEMVNDLTERVHHVVNQAYEYTMRFEPYSHLWEDDKKDYLDQFLKYGRQLTQEEIDAKVGGLDIPEKTPTLEQFRGVIDKFEKLYQEVEQFEQEMIFDKWFRLNMRSFRQSLLNNCKRWSLMFKQFLIDSVVGGLQELDEFIQEAEKGLGQTLREGDTKTLISTMKWLQQMKERQVKVDNMFEPIKQYIELLKMYDYEPPDAVFVQLDELPQKWNNLKKQAIQTKHQAAPLQAKEVSSIRKRISDFDKRQNDFRERFKESAFFNKENKKPYGNIDDVHKDIVKLETEYEEIVAQADLFEVLVPEPKGLRMCPRELRFAKNIWDYIFIVESLIEDWKTTSWLNINVENMDLECKRMGKEAKAMDKDVKQWEIFTTLESIIRNMISSLKSVAELQNPAIKERHWDELRAATKTNFRMDDNVTLEDLLALNLHNFEEEVKNIVDKAVKESGMDKTLRELDNIWSVQEYELETHHRTGTQLIKASEELIEILEDNQVQLQNIAMSKYIAFYKEEVEYWQNRLFMTDQVLAALREAQRAWSHLESIFIAAEDIRKNLPEDSARFDKIDRDFKEVLKKLYTNKNVVETTNQPGVLSELERLQKELAVCEKALADYLETKRLAFPRFYFVSSVDLLDILSNGNEPVLVARHLAKLFDAMAKLDFVKEGNDKDDKDAKLTKTANTMIAKDGEICPFFENCDCTGQVEVWLCRLEDTMRSSVRSYFSDAVSTYEEKPREVWMQDFPAQPALCGTQIYWSSEVNAAFARLEEGYENALKDYFRKQVQQLTTLIRLLLGNLTMQERQKIMTICTIDVHSRDVVGKLIQMKVETGQAFQWQSQLRHRWDTNEQDCFANICDAQFKYWYEYLGNTPRLVITPLTDRCYITLTQSLHLILGGAPAGPAGTGKTETTKDLGRALGMMVYVFNCSEQMDYRSIGNIFKGLAQTGAWGCFDEFNRISVEVLSVVAVQVKCIQDGIRDQKTRFNFMGDEIRLIPTVGAFITMNPGYAGRAELPENLKALFRPCAMVVPDFELICEIMLVAEGFQDARLLARKFITLYTLCKELLSKQDHYDWGLRAIKSLLVVAGTLKRSDPDRPEDQVLMRALRDFNVPKIVLDDIPVFMGLIGDLFPALDVPRKRDAEFEECVRVAAVQLKLQPEDNFVQLQELIDVRHSVFIIGNAGTGKSQIWKTLFKTHYNLKRKPVYNDLNPKAVTNDELFGIINPSTREWKDGIFSVLMRDQANLTGDGPKWIILDGDIDPMWIESLNTVMDDNKVLTLASNERIAMTRMMRLIFEIYTLRVATPATVSRAGILYINPQDLGWTPYVTSWIAKRENSGERAMLTVLFEKYIPTILEQNKIRFKKITPIADIAHLELLCNLLECLLTPENLPSDCPKEWYELYFVFATVWAYGSACYNDQILDHRLDFSKWFQSEFRSVKFPQGGTVFDYFIDQESKELKTWSKIVQPFELDPDIPLQAALVHTAETTRIKYFLNTLMDKGHPVMLIGSAGSGKTVLISEKLGSLSENYLIQNVPFNFYTTSEMLQREGNYGPPGNKKLIYFIDDMNMPEVDTYFTVQPHTLIRQHMDYNHWYDRIKITLKDIHNVQYVSCMNPTAGSFTINPRLQRHFAVFSLSFPGMEALNMIYRTILSQHLASTIHKFLGPVQRTCNPLVNAALSLHNKVAQAFLPTAIKFHYIFNLRDLSNIFQGLLFSTFECLPAPVDLVRLWMHEATRVYGDKLIDEKDRETLSRLMTESMKRGFEDIEKEDLQRKPLIYCHFAQGVGDPKYMPVTDFEVLKAIIVDALKSYNDFNAVMNLVLFDDAVNYVCRISRILESPRGYGLLVGVGGMGKQSLSRLAAYMSGLDVFQVALRKGYGVNDLKNDLSLLYIKAGQKNLGTMFLMTDGQVAEERFLVLINDMLASGDIPDILPDEAVEDMRTEVKTVGLPDTRENCWKFFIDRVRKVLKCVLCFSPVGSTLRTRSRKFPAITNSTSIIWFQGWPVQALLSVSQQFVKEIEVLPPELHDPIAHFMSFVHNSVDKMSEIYLENERRYNYCTPKSFLEQIDLYGKLVTTKTAEAFAKADRLESGLIKLESCAQQVEKLKKVLAVQEVVLKEKNEKADNLIQVVGRETQLVSVEKENAAVEEKKVAVTAEEVTKIKEVCRVELEKAEPALQAAYAALNTLNKANLTEMKTFTSPPKDVADVIAAVYIMWVGTRTGKVPKDTSWKAAKADMMSDAQKFLDGLMTLDKEKITMPMVEKMKPFYDQPNFEPEKIKAKSLAASGLCSYVLNVLKFNDVFQDKRKALNDATDTLNKALDRLKFLKVRIVELEEKLTVLTREYEAAIAAKLKCQAEADKTALTIDLANRLVGGLGAEKNRWIQNVLNFRASTKTIPGDMLLVTAFVSYVGCFSKKYRVDLLDKIWMPQLKKIDPPIPMSDTVDPLVQLTDDAEIAMWNNFGLPSDRMSSENASILMNSQRWPLMIDPQLQVCMQKGIKVIRLGQKGYMDVIEDAIAKGYTVMIENIGENIDPVLDPLLARNLIRKGTAIKMGDKEIDYNPAFRLILQTKLANPHYRPEMQAQTTLINFTVTRDGLEDQLLAEVVKVERPDLESQKSQLTKQQNEFKILLKKLEDDLLTRLQSAQGNFLDDTALVENLETTKRTAQEVEVKAKEAVVTSAEIDAARELYRPAACRASILYFILNDLNKINPIYQFSLKAFSTVFQHAIKTAPHAGEIAKRVENLIDAVTFSVWMYTTRGLFERDKLIFTSQMAFTVSLFKGTVNPKDLDFLLRFPITPNLISPVDFLSNVSWGAIVSLGKLDEYKNLDTDIEGSAKRWKKIVESEAPERVKLPQEWKTKTGVKRLCIMRALRPDRMTYSVSVYIEESLGVKYVRPRRQDFAKSYEESNNTTPIFFILSPGVDPLKDVESIGKKLGFTMDKGNFHNVSLGQGQEIVAENALDTAGDKGHWVILQNIHLVARWLPQLEKKLEQNWEHSNKKYRVFLSAEAAGSVESHILPQGILESSIKITNEPPTGMLANLHKALDNFTPDQLESCSKELEFKAVLFSLCYFHAVVAERRKFGTQGWNRVYPFNNGDLCISANVLYNYLEANSKVPWEDLRYLFGDIMYGGHITDDFDRRLCRSYLEEYMAPELLDGEINYAPGFPAPPSTDFVGYHQYIDEFLPPESPVLYGLHPNAEIGFLTATSENLFKTIFELQPRDSSGGGGQVVTKEDKVKQILDDILERLMDTFNMADLQGKVEDKTPFIIVAIQECERMNFLQVEIKRSLKELNLGLKGELTITTAMEELSNALFLDAVPASWAKRAYPSTLGLGSWYADLLLRAKELEVWTSDFALPAAVWLSGFFNPQSFLTAIMQMTARKQELPLDKMCLQTEVTKKNKEDFPSPPREGAYLCGLYMEGARWDTASGSIAESKLKELYPTMPVLFMKAITQDKADLRNMYECPVYKTRMRGPTYVWTFNLRARDKPTKWVLGGVALLLQV
ncbi:Dynein beta chain, ciliary [Orchesella cincta]|uniref:Dynein beta chain, ciliary n=1 Tax=Orchesella cincta TaxID=48709 RepID=A0A1D2NFC9_ORCCI|nr:Dynein beta chain, ciliary [Orchesella cincta]